MLPYSRQLIENDDIREVVNVLKSDWLTQGPTVRAFEEALAAYTGAKYAVAVPNGTAALHLAYMAAGIGKSDEIITAPNTFAATTNMALVLGAKAVFVDIRMDTYNIDERLIEKHITKRTKALVPIDFAGHPCELDVLQRIARKHKLIIIEDGCHALGGSFKNKKIGGIADMTILSFHPVKPITTGEGGAVLTNNKAWYEKMLSLRTHGMVNDPAKKEKIGPWFHEMEYLSWNYRITDFQCALGLSQLKKIDKWREALEEKAAYYFKKLADFPEVILPTNLPHIKHGWHLFVIRVPTLKRKQVFEYLKKNGIGIQVHYIPVYAHPYYRRNGFAKTRLPNEETYYATCMSIPLYQKLTRKDQDYVISKLREAIALS